MHSIEDAVEEWTARSRPPTCCTEVEQALAHFRELGIEPKRLLADNAFVYRHNRSLRELLHAHAIEHRFIRHAGRRPTANRALPTDAQA